MEKNSSSNVTVKAVRTNAWTGESKDVLVELEKYYSDSLKSQSIKIVKGGFTSYESMRIDRVKRMVKGGWAACTGTKNCWDMLFLPPESMKEILDWLSVEETIEEVIENVDKK